MFLRGLIGQLNNHKVSHRPIHLSCEILGFGVNEALIPLQSMGTMLNFAVISQHIDKTVISFRNELVLIFLHHT